MKSIPKTPCKTLCVNINFLHAQNTCWINREEVQSLFKCVQVLPDIQVPFNNCTRFPITHTAADVTLFAQTRRRLAMIIHVCQLIVHLLRNILKLTLKCVKKTF